MLSVLVVIVLVDIDSLNVTATVVETATLVELSSGATESTVGAVVEEVDVLSVVVLESFVLADVLSEFDPEVFVESSLLAQEMIVRLINVDRKRNKIFFIFS